MYRRSLRTLRAACLILGAAFLAPANAEPPRSFGTAWGSGAVICTDDGDESAEAEADASYARAAAWDARVLGDLEAVCGPELTPLDGGTWGESAPFSGADADGRSAEFRLYVLSDEYAWRLGSSTDVLDGGQVVELSSVLATPQFQSRFCAAKAAFSVGAASHEGPTAGNHRLARARAATVIERLQANRGACPPGQVPIFFAVTLGEHQNEMACPAGAPCSDDTSPQRRVVLVAAETATLGVDLQQALRAAIIRQDVFRGFSIDDYDLFEVVAY
ncbi:MAG: hypothetical protein AAGH87_01800 [Pseudomonadota bacterium]